MIGGFLYKSGYLDDQTNALSSLSLLYAVVGSLDAVPHTPALALALLPTVRDGLVR